MTKTNFDTEASLKLPTPRLELRFILDGPKIRCHYHLVRRHLHDRLVRVAMSNIMTNNSPSDPTDPFGWYFDDGKLTCLPFRQGAQIMHDAAHFGLPAYAVFDDMIFDILDHPQLAQEHFWHTTLGRRHRNPEGNYDRPPGEPIS